MVHPAFPGLQMTSRAAEILQAQIERAARRDWHSNPDLVYRLTEISTGLVYVGRTGDFLQRVRSHINTLRGSTIVSPLYDAWRKAGLGGFLLDVISLHPNSLQASAAEREIIFELKAECPHFGFNRRPTSAHPYITGRSDYRMRKLSLAILATMSLAGCGAPNPSPPPAVDPYAYLLPVRVCADGRDLVRLPDGVLAQRIAWAYRGDGGPMVEYKRFDLSATPEAAC